VLWRLTREVFAAERSLGPYERTVLDLVASQITGEANQRNDVAVNEHESPEYECIIRYDVATDDDDMWGEMLSTEPHRYVISLGPGFAVEANMDLVRRADHDVIRDYRRWLTWIHDETAQRSVPGDGVLTSTQQHSVGIAVESVLTFWEMHGEGLALSSDDRRIAGILADAMRELIKVDDPPRGPIRAALRWFGQKADLAVDEAAKKGGAAVGLALVGGMTYAVAKATGTWDELRVLVHNAKEALGQGD
jgi:hypothetical protein